MPAVVKSGKTKALKFTVDLSAAAADNVIEAVDFEKYLVEHIKVANKLNNLGSSVAVSRDNNRVTVTSNIPFSKRYIKYLTKKYLKKNSVREYLRVIATSKNVYTLKYFNIGENDAEAQE